MSGHFRSQNSKSPALVCEQTPSACSLQCFWQMKASCWVCASSESFLLTMPPPRKHPNRPTVAPHVRQQTSPWNEIYELLQPAEIYISFGVWLDIQMFMGLSRYSDIIFLWTSRYIWFCLGIYIFLGDLCRNPGVSTDLYGHPDISAFVLTSRCFWISLDIQMFWGSSWHPDVFWGSSRHPDVFWLSAGCFQEDTSSILI